MTNLHAFHLAIPVNDLEQARKFYGGLLGCSEGRSSEKWVDINFYGHQLSLHLKPEETGTADGNEVDGKKVPSRHFGVILPWNEWQILSNKLKNEGIEFIIEPYERFRDNIGQQATMFFLDPSGNALEFKSFKDMSQVFAA